LILPGTFERPKVLKNRGSKSPGTLTSN